MFHHCIYHYCSWFHHYYPGINTMSCIFTTDSMSGVSSHCFSKHSNHHTWVHQVSNSNTNILFFAKFITVIHLRKSKINSNVQCSYTRNKLFCPQKFGQLNIFPFKQIYVVGCICTLHSWWQNESRIGFSVCFNLYWIKLLSISISSLIDITDFLLLLLLLLEDSCTILALSKFLIMDRFRNSRG